MSILISHNGYTLDQKLGQIFWTLITLARMTKLKNYFGQIMSKYGSFYSFLALWHLAKKKEIDTFLWPSSSQQSDSFREGKLSKFWMHRKARKASGISGRPILYGKMCILAPFSRFFTSECLAKKLEWWWELWDRQVSGKWSKLIHAGEHFLGR